MADSHAMTTNQTGHMRLEERKILKLIERIQRKLQEKPKPKSPTTRLAS